MNETSRHIAQTLNETENKPQAQISEIVSILGDEKATEYLTQTLALMEEGGMKTEDGKRSRTPGGAFFYLVRGGMTWSQRRKVFPYFNPEGTKITRLPSSPYNWAWRIADFRRFRPGERGVGRVEIKVVGKPLKVIEKTQVTVVTMRSGEPPSLPKGIPAPPATPTVFLILIAAKQWRKVQPYINEPTNKLIVRGWPVYDKKLGTITVLAQSTTSTLLERQKQMDAGKEVEEIDPEDAEDDGVVPIVIDDAELPEN